jgi:Putative prokaryotic signal transducing protein
MASLDEKLARLTSVRTEMEAGVIVGGLEDRGIKATMSGVYTANFRAEAPGWVEVLVAEDDLPQAQAVLEDVQRDNDHIDWSQIDVGEPEDE